MGAKTLVGGSQKLLRVMRGDHFSEITFNRESAIFYHFKPKILSSLPPQEINYDWSPIRYGLLIITGKTNSPSSFEGIWYLSSLSKFYLTRVTCSSIKKYVNFRVRSSK